MLKVSTSIDASNCGERKVAKLLMGDISPGSLVLFNGESGSGKSVFCQQLSYNALYNGTCSVAYFTSASRSADLLDQMESFSFHVQYHFVSDKFRVYELDLINGNPSIDEAIRMLLQCLNDLPPSFTLAVIDNINVLLADMGAPTQIALLRDIKLVCKEKRRSIIVVTNPYAFSRSSLSRMYSLCDYYLNADIMPMPQGLEQMDSRMVRALEMRKISGVEMAHGESVPFEIRTGTGIHILPYVTVRA